MFSLFLVTPFKLALLGLVAILGFTIIRFSWVAFSGEADRYRFCRSLCMTISSVVLVIINNHLLIFWIAWVCVSLSLHRLIVFYPERSRAQLAAHKKFLLARFSELLLAIAFVILYREFNSPYISEIIQKAALVSNNTNLTISAILLALVALIKCAQLPVHGWLIQVVEAPTPVSALLHAGVVNLGGILLLFFAPVLNSSGFACWLVIIIAGISSVISGLVSTTRISIKVKLAWSTSSQMGLMLVEIALGLYDMALLHLFAHSIYKSYSFLNCGNTVNHYLAAKLAGNIKPKARHWIIALAISSIILIIAQTEFSVLTSISATVLTWFALTALIVPSVTSTNKSSLVNIVISISFAGFLLTFYTTAKHHIAHLIGLNTQLNIYSDGLIALLFMILFVLSMALQFWPHVTWVKRVFIWLNAGGYLDEWATRLTLKFWPSESLIQLRRHTQWQTNTEVK